MRYFCAGNGRHAVPFSRPPRPRPERLVRDEHHLDSRPHDIALYAHHAPILIVGVATAADVENAPMLLLFFGPGAFAVRG